MATEQENITTVAVSEPVNELEVDSQVIAVEPVNTVGTNAESSIAQAVDDVNRVSQQMMEDQPGAMHIVEQVAHQGTVVTTMTPQIEVAAPQIGGQMEVAPQQMEGQLEVAPQQMEVAAEQIHPQMEATQEDFNQMAAQELAQLAQVSMATALANNQVDQQGNRLPEGHEYPVSNTPYPVYLYRLSEHAASLLKSLDTMRSDESMCDGHIRCQDGPKIHAHKSLLNACSPYFKRRFRSGDDIMIDLPHYSVKRIVDFIYTGEIAIKSDEVTPLLKAAETMMIQSLMDICVDYMKTHNIGLRTNPDGNSTTFEDGWNLDMCKDTSPMKRPAEEFDDDDFSDEDDENDNGNTIVSGRKKRKRLGNPCPWTCPHCKFRTLSKKRLEDHVSNHTADYGYKCALCTFSAKSNQSLVKHISSGHSTEEMKSLPEDSDYSWMYPPEHLDTNKKASIKAKSVKALMAAKGPPQQHHIVITPSGNPTQQYIVSLAPNKIPCSPHGSGKTNNKTESGDS